MSHRRAGCTAPHDAEKMMGTLTTAFLAALQIAATPAPDTTGAFQDARAAELVALARQARATQQATLTSYSALAQERATALLRLPGRDRVLYRREMAARLDWERAGPATVTLLGAREYVPVPGTGVRVLHNAALEALDVAFRPDDVSASIGLGSFRFGPHPLNPGAEANYRYSSGAASTIILPGGGSVLTHELVVIPRRADPELVSGSLWLEDGTGRVVQEAWRRAAPIPAGTLPVVGAMALDVREIVIEHGLWESQWWMPRIVAIDGVFRAGRAAAVPFRYERSYSDYTVAGNTTLAPDTTLAADTIMAADTLAADTMAADTPLVFQPPTPVPALERWRVILPEDRSSLLASEFLPPSIFDEGSSPIRADELAPLRLRLDALETPAARIAAGGFFVELAPLDQVRFNSVEGLSFNVAAGVDFGGVRSYADARIATAGQVLRGQLGLAAGAAAGHLGFAAFERVQAADPATRPFDAGNSLSTFLLGTDYGAYYTARGLELARESRPGASMPWTLRFFTEEQDSVALRDPFTLADVFRAGRVWLRAGFPVEPATQHGAVFHLAAGGGIGPEQPNWRVQPRIEAVTGDHDFGRLSVIGSFSLPLFLDGIGPFRNGLNLGVEAGAGTAVGTPPGQGLWYLGGPTTVRGYPAASAAGEGFWRTRVEVGTTFPALRVSLFNDVGQTWGRGGFHVGGFDGDHFRLTSMGIGVSLLEGLLRVDLARAVEFRPGWRVNIIVDNVL